MASSLGMGPSALMGLPDGIITAISRVVVATHFAGLAIVAVAA
jgi:hypothetical protein